LSGGGGFGITPSRAAALGGQVGTTAAADAISTGDRIPALGPEKLYAFEPGVRFTSVRVSAAFTAYNLEYLDTVQRRAIVFPPGVVGTVISGFEIVRQDASGLAYIAQDIRPIATSVNLDRSRITGFEADASVDITAAWTAFGYFAMSTGRLLTTGEPIRRMSPPMGGARLRWSGDRAWVEGVMSFARAQTRLNPGDVSDARIGALRTRASIASYFNGTATDLGLVKGGVLLETGETLAEVQNRVLGTAASSSLFTEAPGFVVFGARAAFRLLPRLDVTVIGENLTDRNYRLYGSGVDSPGINLAVRTRYRF
jgi:outer membrane receptor protein involved in Fe transport